MWVGGRYGVGVAADPIASKMLLHVAQELFGVCDREYWQAPMQLTDGVPRIDVDRRTELSLLGLLV